MTETKAGPHGEVIDIDGVADDSVRIWKYALALDPPRDHLVLPRGARLLHVGVQGLQPFVWAAVDPRQPERRRNIKIAGTGQSVDLKGWRYVGSFSIPFQAAPFVGHVFEGSP